MVISVLRVSFGKFLDKPHQIPVPEVTGTDTGFDDVRLTRKKASRTQASLFDCCQNKPKPLLPCLNLSSRFKSSTLRSFISCPVLSRETIEALGAK